MRLQQVDNRRVRKARERMNYIVNILNNRQLASWFDYDDLRLATMKFSWLLDQQSARIARRFGKSEFCGVPSTFAVRQAGYRAHRSLL